MNQVSSERLYRTADDEIVREDDPRAAFHLVGPGKPIPDGYDVPAWAVAGKAKDDPEPDEPTSDETVTDAPESAPVKQAAKVADKAVKKTANKRK